MDTRDEALKKVRAEEDTLLKRHGRVEVREKKLPGAGRGVFLVRPDAECSASLSFEYALPSQAPPEGTMVRGWLKDGTCEVFGRSTGELDSCGELRIVPETGTRSRPCWEVLAPVEEDAPVHPVDAASNVFFDMGEN